MLLLLLLLLLFSIYCLYIILSYPKYSQEYSTDIKGICYFDIDGTLISANGSTDEMIKVCLDNNFAVGIITASTRKIEHICDGDKGRFDWMPNLLCKQFSENGGKMYNSIVVVSGDSIFPRDYPHWASNGVNPGYIKGFNMKYGRDKFYPHVPDEMVVLFDDQQPVLDGVKQFNPNFQTQKVCENKFGSCVDSQSLSVDVVRRKLEEMTHHLY